MKKRLPVIIGLLSMLALAMPALQQGLHFMSVRGLNGEVMTDSIRPSYSWWDRGLQDHLESYASDSLSIYPACVRTRNQFEFTFFDKLNARDIYEYDGIFYRMASILYNEHAYFAGMDKVRSHVASLQRFQERIGKDSIPVYVIITPSKLHYFRDQLPYWNKTTSKFTNYIQYKKALAQAGIEVLDVDAWFIAQKKHHRYPVMATGGVHWTLYGSAIAMDSLIRRINHDKRADFQRVQPAIKPAPEFYVEDMDIVNLSNLMYPPKDKRLRSFTFPEIQSPKKRLRPLIVSDSFIHVIAWSDLHKQVFTPESSFFYYFNTRIGLGQTIDPKIDEAVVDEELRHADCVILMTDIQNLEQFGFGFIEKYLQAQKGL